MYEEIKNYLNYISGTYPCCVICFNKYWDIYCSWNTDFSRSQIHRCFILFHGFKKRSFILERSTSYFFGGPYYIDYCTRLELSNRLYDSYKNVNSTNTDKYHVLKQSFPVHLRTIKRKNIQQYIYEKRTFIPYTSNGNWIYN